MNRRSFFKFLPVAPVVLAAEGARAATVDQAPIGGTSNIVLHAAKWVKPLNCSANLTSREDSLTFRSLHVPQYDPDKQVSMAVGQDGNLWIKSKNDEWKRVVTE